MSEDQIVEAIALTDKQILSICKMYEVFGDLEIEFIYLGHAVIMANDRARKSCNVAQPVEQTAQSDFKNFHRLLCERFGYVHDEQGWQRDQLSLIEWIASQAGSRPVDLTDEQIEDLQEAREILENMVRSVELDGNYSTEATCTFLRQALQCLPAARCPLGKHNTPNHPNQRGAIV